MIFPSDNLGTASKPWAREITKQLSNIIDTTVSNNVNNTARDNQLNSSIIAASAAATSAQNAVAEVKVITDAVFVTGTTEINGYNIKAGTINASAINAGTLTGFTLQTAASGRRVVIGGTTATFYDESSNYSGTITVAGYANEAVMQINGPFSSRSISFSAGNTYIAGGGGTYINLSDEPRITLGGATTVTGTLSINSNASVSGFLYNYGATSVGSTANVRLGADSRFYTISSSRRYKTDIQDVDYGLKALQLRPRTWIDKVAYEENGNSAEGLTRIPGFIAEELDEIGLGQLVEYKDGIPESISYDRMLGAVIPVIQYQDTKIKDLEARLALLEAK